jgi:hypothetical protein
MTTIENFSAFKNNVFFVIHQNSHWLNIELERELGFLQDYLNSLSLTIKNIADEDLPKIGLIVKQDFIDLASNLENITFEFFRRDIYKMEINKLIEWHKYHKEITLERLKKTKLFTERSKIDKIIFE